MRSLSSNFALLPRRLAGLAALTAVCLSSAGCALIPKDGPAGKEVVSQSAVQFDSSTPETENGYVLIKAAQETIKFMNAGVAQGGQGFPAGLNGGGVREVPLQPGDRVSITIFEAGSGGLFIPAEPGSRAGNFVQVPSQQIDSRGQIVVPYAGVIQAAGKLPSRISTEIVARLSNRAIEPQVIVSIDERRSNDVSVLGEVATPLRFSMDPGGTRLMGAIARAGGARYPEYETYVTLQRGGKIHRADMSVVVKNPAQDIRLSAGDVVYVGREPKTYMVFGATPSPGVTGGQASRRFTFDTEAVTLAEALAKAGGLAQDRANPSSFFLYRNEQRERLAKLDPSFASRPESVVPTIYSFDMRRGDAFFLAQTVRMKDKDVIFVADSESVDLIKMLNVVRAINSTVGEIKDTTLLLRQ